MSEFFNHVNAWLANHAPIIFFWVIAAMVGTSAVMVVLTQNIVRAAAWLLFTLAGVSILYFQLGADFVGATQLIVYVGGTLVLVVFGVMLTAQGPFVTLRTGAAEWALTIVTGFLFLGVLVGVTSNSSPGRVGLPDKPQVGATARIGYGFLGMTEAADMHMDEAGNPVVDSPSSLTGMSEPKPRKQMSYLLPFEIVSVHLLVVLIGAAYLARAKRRRGVSE
ncbi:MAG: NADH-quinone oxidoreductase subunit J [Gemmataceae bacterium]